MWLRARFFYGPVFFSSPTRPVPAGSPLTGKVLPRLAVSQKQSPISPRLRVSGSVFRVPHDMCRVSDLGLRVPGFRFRVPGFGFVFGVSGSGFRVSGFGFRV